MLYEKHTALKDTHFKNKRKREENNGNYCHFCDNDFPMHVEIIKKLTLLRYYKSQYYIFEKGDHILLPNAQHIVLLNRS